MAKVSIRNIFAKRIILKAHPLESRKILGMKPRKDNVGKKAGRAIAAGIGLKALPRI